jgi:hypothetical protein
MVNTGLNVILLICYCYQLPTVAGAFLVKSLIDTERLDGYLDDDILVHDRWLLGGGVLPQALALTPREVSHNDL